MKKMYLKPVIELTTIHMANFVCISGNNPTVTPTAEWGDQDIYAPDKWINESYDETFNWPSVDIEEDAEDELTSRSKGFTW